MRIAWVYGAITQNLCQIQDLPTRTKNNKRKKKNQYIQENVGFSQIWDFTKQDMMCLPASLLFDVFFQQKGGFGHLG